MTEICSSSLSEANLTRSKRREKKSKMGRLRNYNQGEVLHSRLSGLVRENDNLFPCSVGVQNYAGKMILATWY